MASSTSGGGASGPETRLSVHQRGTRSGSPNDRPASTCTATIQTENNNTLLNDFITAI